MDTVKQYPLICRRHGFDEVPAHLIPDCPICGDAMEKCETYAEYQTDFDLFFAYKEAGFDLRMDVFSYAFDVYECADCPEQVDDDDDTLYETVDAIRWYFIYGDNYQPLVPIHPDEYEKIYTLMYQKQGLEAGQQVMPGFELPDFHELDDIIVDPA